MREKKFFPKFRTKNYSSVRLRNHKTGLSSQTMRSIVRLGSITDTSLIFPKSIGKRPIIEINTVESIQNSRSKVRMKTCFDEAQINHAKWQSLEENLTAEGFEFPIILKRIYGFKGKGMYLVDSSEKLSEIVLKIDTKEYICEEYHNYNMEVRLHCTEEGCFYAIRKMLKHDAKERWYRNDSNCVWILEENPLFNKPSNWDEIITHCVKALKATGLSIGGFDVRIQSKNKKNPKFIIIEVNSAPSFGEITTIKYKETINKLITNKIDHYYD